MDPMAVMGTVSSMPPRCCGVKRRQVRGSASTWSMSAFMRRWISALAVKSRLVWDPSTAFAHRTLFRIRDRHDAAGVVAWAI
jgi:hypothetical protein